MLMCCRRAALVVAVGSIVNSKGGKALQSTLNLAAGAMLAGSYFCLKIVFLPSVSADVLQAGSPGGRSGQHSALKGRHRAAVNTEPYSRDAAGGCPAMPGPCPALAAAWHVAHRQLCRPRLPAARDGEDSG